ncbi:MAG: VOC family protein [Pseudomonadota bacterium]
MTATSKPKSKPMPKLDYVEFASTNLAASKTFFKAVFAWQFEDYGDAYSAIIGAGLDGGIFAAESVQVAAKGAPLLVFLSDEIELTQSLVEEHGGKISQAIFDFPGGRRFHFIEPGGNELAVWTKAD